ncbi:hypothetical protein GCM10010103_32420 [Streptomyces paradoxus]|uniref:Enoyl-CoA hydratase/carnithine racemase n=1 Tax=Streptomyces paradoxus TaxID=66375 RepID=A0A7W9WG09_9ACTN|nr:enoyl-CoA hydratase/carnithine racemase [Streptomyces paradoxus]
MSTPTPPVVRTERIGSTLLITLDRPEARNAVNAATATALAAALDELEADPALRAGVQPRASTRGFALPVGLLRGRPAPGPVRSGR